MRNDSIAPLEMVEFNPNGDVEVFFIFLLFLNFCLQKKKTDCPLFPLGSPWNFASGLRFYFWEKSTLIFVFFWGVVLTY